MSRVVVNAVMLAASCICLRGSSTAAYLATRARLNIPRGNKRSFVDSRAPRIIRTQSVSSFQQEKDAESAQQPPAPLPPVDDTFSSPLAAFKELLAAPTLPTGAARYDTIGLMTGGIWRTKWYGMLPCTLLTAQATTQWLTKEEANGNVYSAMSPSALATLGRKSVVTLGAQPKIHAAVRTMFNEALSPKATLKLAPFVQSCLDKRVRGWDAIASSDKTIKMFEEISDLTMEIISHIFLGDYGTGQVLDDVKRIVPKVSVGLASKPRRFPWPMDRLSASKFDQALDARKEFDAVIGDVVRRRRLDISGAHDETKNMQTAGVLDAMLVMQAKQVEAGGRTDEEMEYDDVFIFDNTYNGIFAGFETTSVTISRMLQFLASDESKDQRVLEYLREELDIDWPSLESCLAEGKKAKTSEQGRSGLVGVLKNFPLLQAVVLESNRLSPAVSSVFRVARNDVKYNGFLIPKGEKICWNLNNGYKAKSLYPQPAKFCPFRFLHGDSEERTSRVDQPTPLVFGFGKHMCPGRELSMLEVLMFLRTFLHKYSYRLVKGQDLRGKLPVNAPKSGLEVVLSRVDI